MEINTLVGTYHLVSWENRHKSGKVSHPLGPDAKGVISYSEDGYVFVHIMANNRNNHSVEDLFGGEISEIVNSATSHVSYCGTYHVTEHEVIHRVSISSFPNWVSSEQRRNWEFKNEYLLLSAHGVLLGNEIVDAYLKWQPANAQHDISAHPTVGN